MKNNKMAGFIVGGLMAAAVLGVTFGGNAIGSAAAKPEPPAAAGEMQCGQTPGAGAKAADMQKACGEMMKDADKQTMMQGMMSQPQMQTMMKQRLASDPEFRNMMKEMLKAAEEAPRAAAPSSQEHNAHHAG